MRARIAAKSSAARGRVTSPPIKLAEARRALVVVYGLMAPKKGALPSRTKGPRGKRKSGDRAEKVERLVDQLHRLCLVDRQVLESGVLQHLDHLCRDLVAPL